VKCPPLGEHSTSCPNRSRVSTPPAHPAGSGGYTYSRGGRRTGDGGSSRSQTWVGRPGCRTRRIPAPRRGLDHFSILMESALSASGSPHRDPSSTTGRSFTPKPVHRGGAPELAHFFVGVGFNSVGIASPVGRRALGEWIVPASRPVDLVAQDNPPLRPVQRQQPVLHDRVGRSSVSLRDPLAQPSSSRPPFGSPVYDRLLASGASSLQDGWSGPTLRPAGREASRLHVGRRTGWPVGRRAGATRTSATLLTNLLRKLLLTAATPTGAPAL